MKSLILFAVTLISVLSFAAQDCRQDPYSDIFESRKGMPSGKHAGDCLTNDIKRNFYIPTEKELSEIGYEKQNDFKNKVVVVNFSHDHQFMLAEIPVDKIQNVVFQLERFNPKWIAAHTQLRFDFSEPVILKSQYNGKMELGQIRSIVFSTEAILRINGPKFDLIPGVFDNFGAVYRLVSLDQKYQDVVIEEKNPVEQFDLNLSSKQAQDLFKIILSRHSSKDVKHVYNTVGLNCTNVLFQDLDQLLNYKGVFFGRTRTTIPVLSPGVLKAVKLIKTTIPTRANFAEDTSGLSH
jgi:hypothetical protein